LAVFSFPRFPVYGGGTLLVRDQGRDLLFPYEHREKPRPFFPELIVPSPVGESGALSGPAIFHFKLFQRAIGFLMLLRYWKTEKGLF
jgi:hypothetical protein